MKYLWLGMLVLVTVLVFGCTRIPRGLEPVTGFDGDRYLGKWYEIARLDHSFEKDLSNVSAEYARGENGYIRVLNRGYNEKSGEWKQIEGKARYISEDSVGSLKVSFFGPFYGGYHIIALDDECYNYAMVAGPSRSYLWMLSRTPSMSPEIYLDLTTRAAKMGFDTDKLIKVSHHRHANNLKKESSESMISKPESVLAPCPQSPNCVSSLAEDKRHYIEPLQYEGQNSEARGEILSIIDSMRGARVTKSEERYIHAEFVSFIFKFIDDVEFYFDPTSKLIQVKSASRIGHYDWGVNRRRIEAIRKKLDHKEITGQQESESNTYDVKKSKRGKANVQK
jgi:apolipoprotein D and lipocalin family protein